MAKTLVLFFLFLQITSFIAFTEELETFHNKPATPLHPPTKSPVHKPHHNHSPSHAPSHVHTPLHPPHPAKPPTHHHHQHQHHSPSPTPSHVHTPIHPRHPAKPPTHHHHHHHSPAHAPIKPPVHTPLHHPHPAKPPTHHHHQHHSPSPAPSHFHTPLHPRHPAKPPTHYHHHSPAHAPIKPPVHTPLLPPQSAKPPTHHHHHPPAHAPTHTPLLSRSLIVVEGVVYVKSCNHNGVDTLKGATPLLGAIVKLQCNNAKHKLVLKAKTDKKGYFYIGGPKNIVGYSTRHCNVVLDNSPKALKPSNLHGGLTGALLKPVKRSVSKGISLKLFTVGPFAFEPKCHH
ncbi:hypothetical protein MtrunA17_Chr5g0420431 [Medicago truncatula]|uniref:Pollen Ole e I family allergen n=1 Tax=Medicago truncatula TaxID=3880 RepID=G7JZ73_MEDTR|nr:non-classical arabinogalactan protein 30 [Medicago truncatula]AES97258.1 pollen Ole e I family allergen [Medicago truncatula]RHN55668.1 hypothetical protein MtrunA17_Chr5g0420431 [Medicago truncatula]